MTHKPINSVSYLPVQMNLPQTGYDVMGHLKRLVAADLKATKPQLPCDVGLFSDEANQLDLIEMLQEPLDE